MNTTIPLLVLAVIVGCGSDSVATGFSGFHSDPEASPTADSDAKEKCPTESAIQGGVDDVSNPKLLPESKVEPKHPKKARKEKVEGMAVVQAVIDTDGSVCGCEAIRVNPEGWGFEEAAIEAVEQWRYHPAMKDGKPVAVYFTVFVDFSLDR
ncbi:MAG: energy transducer TonB [Sedimenticolaceae bacterium]